MARRPFTTLDGRTYSNTLVRRFNPLVNVLRDLCARFGLRPRRVFLVTTRWTAGTFGRGAGQEYVVSEREILPMPKVIGVESLDESVAGPGVVELGAVTVEKINPDFTEEELRGLSRDGEPVPDDVSFFYEIEFLEKQGGSFRRRFSLSGAPAFQTFGWSVRLERAPTGDRGQDKTLRS